MQLLSDAEVEARLAWPQVFAALESAFARRAAEPRAFALPERQALPLPQGTGLVMPCADREGFFGVKQVSVLPDNPARGRPSVQAWYTLFGPEGSPALACSATALTRLRTAGVSAVAARHLAAPRARALLVVGSGALAPWMARAHAAARDYARVLLWGRDPAKARAVAEALGPQLGRAVEVPEALEPAVREADVISVATTAREPVLRGAWLRPGQHLDLVGAFSPEMAEADAEAVKRADVFVDDRQACQVEAGDLIQAQAQGWSFDLVEGELAEVVAGKAGRQGPERLTLFKSVGLALEDLALARLLAQGG